MSHPPERSDFFRSLLTSGRRWGLVRLALLAGGVGLLLFSFTFLLAAGGDGAPPPSAAAGSVGDATTVEQDGTLGVGAALAGLDAGALDDGLAQLAGGLPPTLTSTPTLTLTPTPALTPTPVPQQPPAPFEEPVAPTEEPVAPPDDPVAPPAPPAAPPQQVPTPQDEPEPPSEVATPTPQPPAPSCPTASMSGFALDVFNALNNERTQQGLPALVAHGCVVHVAQLRSDDMASRGYFAHTSPEGESAFSLMDQHGIAYGWAGENLARNNYPDDESVAVAVRALMASDGHRENILRQTFTHLGVGAASDGAGMKYFTMIFIGPP